MKKATESAAKWLTERVKANPKLNPIPYPFFRSIINKQIEWATKRGTSLDFDELAEAVRTELLSVGIHTMSDNRKESKPEHESASLFTGTDAETGESIPPLFIHFGSVGEAMCAATIFDWLQKVLTKAHTEKYSGLKLTADGSREVHHA